MFIPTMKKMLTMTSSKSVYDFSLDMLSLKVFFSGWHTWTVRFIDTS